MNIKLTFRYLLSIAIVAVIVVLINITIIYLSLYSKNTNSLIKYDGNNKITSFVRNFEKNLAFYLLSCYHYLYAKKCRRRCNHAEY